MWDIQVIAPTRIGAAGTGELNRILQQAINPPDPSKKELPGSPFFGKATRFADQKQL
jgi:exodeoxyribonuclease V alpha subunit